MAAHNDLGDLFHLPEGNRVAAFFQTQVHLYRQNSSLQDYFEPLQLDTGASPRLNFRELRASSRLIAWALKGAHKVSHFHARRKIKTDILFCPAQYFARHTEISFLVRTLLALAQTDATILCLLPASAPCRDELDTQLASAGRSGQVEFLDPAAPLDGIEAPLLSRVARMRGRSAFEETIQILDPLGLSPGSEVIPGFERTAYFVEAWERLAPGVEFDFLVARCHWYPLCSPVCRTARRRGKPVITFQQGVIGHTLDVPLSASKYIAFGRSSASFLARLNQRFFQTAGMPEPPVEYVDGGSLFDTITPLPDQFDLQTLLLVDVAASPGDFYGVGSQCLALLQLAGELLAADLPLRRLLIRPHPYWSNLDFESCQRLAREHPGRCELSHPVWSLQDDLRRSSAVVGIFSGVLTVASACGLPTIFLETEQGFTTGDLAGFSGQTFLPDAAFREIGRILTDRRAYVKARMEALGNAQEYYANGTNLDLTGPFFTRLLRSDTVVGQSLDNLQ